jgi:hypothetical protein
MNAPAHPANMLARAMTKKTYDQRCYDLAAIFLGDEPDLHNEHNIVGLASLIQETIEDEIAHLKEQWRVENGQFGVGA